VSVTVKDFLGFVVNPPPGDGSRTAASDQLPSGLISSGSQSSPVLFVDSFGARGDGVTNDTAAVQTAVNAAGSLGAGVGAAVPLYFTPGKKYIWNRVTPASYVNVIAYGAVLQRDPAFSGDYPLFYSAPYLGIGSPVTQFSIRGATMTGTGTETPLQQLVLIDQGTFLTFEDNYIHDMGTSPFYISNSQYVWFHRNRVVNCVGIYNNINVGSTAQGNLLPTKYVWIDSNVVIGCVGSGIALVSSYSTRTDPVIDAHITNNTCVTAVNPTSSGWPIAVEQGGPTGAAPNVSRIDIAGNTCVQNGTFAASNEAIVLTNDSTPQSNDPLCISDVTIRGNRLFAQGAGTAHGLLCQASNAAITDNFIRANGSDIVLQSHGSAVISRHVVSGNVGHFGTGSEVLIFGAGVDTTQISGTNTQ
jgi:hypothetical protein